ncbi:hypothetical protein J4526_00025 [Desulfurococcaceae archaeon MEX13E-LK6-19]|nr:hypothetical protein J4526_00025 [Desulfurococcaceae archaeon MEX13E-LK6-19]
MIFKRRRSNPIKALLRSLVAIRSAISKLDALLSRINGRREYLMQMALKLDNMGNTFLAKKYIEEAKRLELIEQRISYIKLVMEKLSITLELSIELKDFNKSLVGVMEVIDILKKVPESTIPDLGITITELETYVREAINSSGVQLGYGLPSSPSISDEEAIRVLEEAKTVAKQKLLGELSTS